MYCILNFAKYKEKPTKLKFSFNTITRNGIPTVFANTHVKYDWKLDKNNNLKDLDTKVTIKGEVRYIFNYRRVNNATIIRERTSAGIATTTKPGFVAVTVRTEGDSVKVNY